MSTPKRLRVGVIGCGTVAQIMAVTWNDLAPRAAPP
jgi:hypothetical protein